MRWRFAFSLCLACAASVAAAAPPYKKARPKGEAADEQPTNSASLPADSPNTPKQPPALPSSWIKGPYTLDSFKGKGVLLYFFEETCPDCRKKWPELAEAAKKVADEPVVFIAVNSGNPKSVVEKYVQANNVPWPVIVDQDRQFEKACGVAEISLQNIMQWRVVTAEGQMQNGNWADVEGTIKKALEGAKWNFDPKDIPSALKPAWRSIELGQYAKAAQLLNRYVGSSNKELSEPAKKLNAVVNKLIEPEIAAAKAVAAKGSKWDAYNLYVSISDRFAGYKAADEALKNRKNLAKDSEVKAEMDAQRKLELYQHSINAEKETIRERAIAGLKKLVQDQPNTLAAKEAQKLIDSK